MLTEYLLMILNKQKLVSKKKKYLYKIKLRVLSTKFFMNNDFLPLEQYTNRVNAIKLLTAPLQNHGKQITNVWLTQLYLKALLYNFTGFYTNWVFLNINVVTAGDEFGTLWYRVYSKYKLGKLYTSRHNFMLWFAQLTYFKDPNFLITIVKKLLMGLQLKHHRRVFSFINKFLVLWYLKVTKLKKLKGYSIFFKGKLGKKGSVRKAKFFAKKGLVSFTNKSLRVNYRTYFVWTHTGVIGAGISIFY